MHLTDDATMACHTQGLQWFINQLVDACKDLGLAISITITNVTRQDVLRISLGNHTLEGAEVFTYLSSKIFSICLSETSIQHLQYVMHLLFLGRTAPHDDGYENVLQRCNFWSLK